MTCGRDGQTRRAVLGGSLRALAAGWAAMHLPRSVFARTASAPAAAPGKSQVALTAGDDRAANIFEALRRIEPQVRAKLAGRKRIVIKPNLVHTQRQLSATHADCMRGILDFLSRLTRDEILVAESSASGPATEGFDNYRYLLLAKDYRVRFVDLDAEPWEVRHVVDQRHRPQPIRFSRMLADPETFVVSSAVFKTHDRAVVTLSLKNLVVGAALKDATFRWDSRSRGKNDKPLVHGGPENQGIHFNLFSLGRVRTPDLAVLDGFQGMEGNGPVSGTPVEQRVAVASTDWLAADRVGVELMGFDFRKVGYLTFCAAAGMGESDPARMELLGEPIARYARQYKPHDSIEKQYRWMQES